MPTQFGINYYKKPKNSTVPENDPNLQSSYVGIMGRISLISSSVALVLVGGLSLTGCGQVTQNAKDVATSTAQSAIGPAVAPVLNLLKQGQAKMDSGDVAGAVTSMGGFQAIWEKASPIIKPLAGDKWTSIESAAQGLTATFSKGTPSVEDAKSAISGLLGPLSALAGK